MYLETLAGVVGGLHVREGTSRRLPGADEAHDLPELAAVDQVRASRQEGPHVDALAGAVPELVVERLDGLEHVPAWDPLLRGGEQAVEDVEDEQRPAERPHGGALGERESHQAMPMKTNWKGSRSHISDVEMCPSAGWMALTAMLMFAGKTAT